VAHHVFDSPDYWRMPERFKSVADVPFTDCPMAAFIMGDELHDDAPMAVVFKQPPGNVVTRHAHDCYRFEIIVSGSVDVGDRILHAGDVMTANPGEFYGPHVAGPEGCVSVEVFSRAEPGFTTSYELPDGTIGLARGGQGERRPDNQVGGVASVADKVAAIRAAANLPNYLST
jgi:quercetin dioxygenase-like cupin family protein